MRVRGVSDDWSFSEKTTQLPLGFNYSFGSLHQEGLHEVTEGFRKSTKFDPFSIKFMLPALFPPARLIVCCHPSTRGSHPLTYQ
jgi:hypothetical protein